MAKYLQSERRTLVISGVLICAVILSLGNFNNPPNGFTGAPGDGLCSECHTLGSGMQNGSIILNGLPSTIIANQTYTLSVTVTNPNGIADFAGFQTVVLNAGNLNAGSMSNPSSGSTIQTSGGRTYHEHNPAQMFPMSNAVTWTVDWMAPVGSGTITLYGAGNVANGNGNDNGDLIVTSSISGTLMTPLEVEITNVNDVTCFGVMDGSVTADANFGSPDYTYAWSNGGSGATINNLGPSTYTVTVTDMAGATATASAEVIEPALFEIVAATITDVSCHGGSDGMIVLILDGGTMPYNGTQGDIATFPNLAAGDYAISITDAHGCVASGDYTITEPPALNISVTVVLDPECAGEATGQISIEGSGGIGEITYAWSNGGSSGTISNLEAGDYTVTVTDDNGCTAEEFITLNDPEPIVIDLLFQDDISCHGADDGEIGVDANGGTGSLSYQWSNGATSSTITGLGTGTYAITVTDDNGCTATDFYMITEPPLLVITIAGTMSLQCFGDSNGSLQAQASGGTPAYSYLWSNNAMNDEITGLAAGMYEVTVTDANGCTEVASTEITQPTQLLPNATSTNESAPGAMDGTATSAPSGGTPGYTFQWNTGATTAMITGLPPGSYTVTVTDANGCVAMQTVIVSGVNCMLTVVASSSDALCFGDSSGTAALTVMGAVGPVSVLWTTGEMTLAVGNLPAGMYTATVTDSAGCVSSADVTIGQPAMLMSICTAVGETMDGGNDGMIACTVSGGTMPYHFLWSNGDTTQNIMNLAPGTYFVTITDANGCSTADMAIVNSFSCAMLLNVTVANALCFGEPSGIAVLSITGGTEPYAILWSNGDTGASTDSLSAGVYSVEVTDADDCVSETMFVIGEPDALTVTVDTIIPVTQSGNGAIQVTISGGTPPYTSTWTKDGALVSTNEDIADLTVGDYELVVTDANGCTLGTGTLVITIMTGTATLDPDQQFRLWPNPASGEVTLIGKGNAKIEGGVIYSPQGKAVWKLNAQDFKGTGVSIRVHIDGMTTGLYYLQIVTSEGYQIIPFIKI